MSQQQSGGRLCSIATLWGIVREAHGGDAEAARAAQAQLLTRYGGAIRRYLMACVRDPEAAEELFQQFALSFLQGDFRKADPSRGRFRDYVKTVLVHMIQRRHRTQQRQPHALAADHPEPAAPPEPTPNDPVFLDEWREDLLNRCWLALAAAEAKGGQPYHSVLRFQAENAGLRSPEMAAELGRRLGRPLTAAALRQILHRAREKFADFLVEEVAHSLREPTDDVLAQELIDLGLFEHCRPAFERHSKEA